MPSNALLALNQNLKDVEEVIKAHESLTGGGKGKPSGGQGAALTRAGVVLLAATMEAFVEELFREAVALLYPRMTTVQQRDLFKDTVDRLNNADVTKTNLLYFNLGIPWVLNDVRWKKFSNASFQKALNSLVSTRNRIAHGGRPKVGLKKLRDWLKLVQKYGSVMEAVVKRHLSGTRNAVTVPW